MQQVRFGIIGVGNIAPVHAAAIVGTPGAGLDAAAAGHTAQFQDFAVAIRERRPPLVDGREGQRSVELVEAIYRSARTNAPVSLPLPV